MFLSDADIEAMTGVSRKVHRPEWIDPHGADAVKHWKRVQARFGFFPKDILRGMPSPDRRAPTNRSGVYFLWCGPVLVYVGKSKQIVARIDRHKDVRDGRLSGSVMAFDRVTYLDMTDHDQVQTDRESYAIDRLERQYIKAYQPHYNWSGR